VLIADAADEGHRRLPPPPNAVVTPVVRGQIARDLAAEELRGPLVCRACALELVERMVRASVEVAEEDLRARMKEQMKWPN
jgi:hypothetical protein